METCKNLHIWDEVILKDWNDWHWQLKNAIRSVEEVKNIFSGLIDYELGDPNNLKKIAETFEIKITPHIVQNILKALKSGDVHGGRALLATFVPNVAEMKSSDDGIDGIGEESEVAKPAPLVTNFYKDRVLLFASNMCPAYCRYCFRRRKVGDRTIQETERATDPQALEKAINYLRQNKKIQEVIISGGDPLIFSDDKILHLLEQLKTIEHIKVLRFDTKVLTVLPQRITPSLIEILKKFKPLYIVGNFLHSIELTSETVDACNALTDVGIPVVSHTALLKGINDDPEIIADLMWRLFENRIRPYYLIQFIPTKWTEHFRVPIKKGLEIMGRLHGHLSGLANPTYIVYLPEGAGKVPIYPNYIVKHTEEGYYLKNFEGRTVLYPEKLTS